MVEHDVFEIRYEEKPHMWSRWEPRVQVARGEETARKLHQIYTRWAVDVRRQFRGVRVFRTSGSLGEVEMSW